MNLLGSLLIACSMYSKIPVQQVEWSKERMKYALCFFPFIGILLGLSLWIFGKIAVYLSLSQMTYACFGTVLPILITGGIHMDGFIDVMDAKSSYLSKEQKIEILKDPHIGAFAMIGASVYFLVYAGAFSMLPIEKIPVFAAAFVIIRALSGMSVVTAKKAKKDGLAADFAKGAENKIVIITMILYLTAAFGFIWKRSGIRDTFIIFGITAIIFTWYIFMSKKEFGGITGDLAGYFLQVCELGSLLTVAIII